MLCFGDENRRLNPEFNISEDYVEIFLSKNKPVKLYQGYEPNILWIDSDVVADIEDVLLHIDKLKKIALFKAIDRVQALKSNIIELPNKFYEIKYTTVENKKIIERMLK